MRLVVRNTLGVAKRGEPQGSTERQVRGWLAAVAVVSAAALAVAGGYLAGRSGGRDLDVLRAAAKASGEAKGHLVGRRAGFRRGFETGHKAGERAGFAPAYR